MKDNLAHGVGNPVHGKARLLFSKHANVQNGDERNLMESGFSRKICPSAHDSWQFLRFEGKICSLRRSFTTAGRQTTFSTYPGTRHWFFDAIRVEAYDASAAALAWERTVALPPRRIAPLGPDGSAGEMVLMWGVLLMLSHFCLAKHALTGRRCELLLERVHKY